MTVCLDMTTFLSSYAHPRFSCTVFTFVLSMLLLFGGRIEMRIHHAPYTTKINHPVLCITFVAHPKPRAFPNLLERIQQDCEEKSSDNLRNQPSSIDNEREPCAFPN